MCAHAWQAAIEEVCWKMSILSIQQLVCEWWYLVNGPLKDSVPPLPVLVSVVSEHSKQECSLFVSERFEISGFSLLSVILKQDSSVFCGFWGYHDAERNAANGHGCLFHVEGSFHILCICVRVENLMSFHGNLIKHSDPNSQFSVWNIWAETDNCGLKSFTLICLFRLC